MRVLTEALEDREAAARGQADVEQDQIRRFGRAIFTAASASDAKTVA